MRLNTKITGVLALAMLTAGLGCTREVIIPADQLAHEDRLLSGASQQHPPGTSYCTQIDSGSGRCAAGSWAVVPE